MLRTSIVVFCFGLALVHCYPTFDQGGYYPQRAYRSAYPVSAPQKTMVFHGYYARPQSAARYPESAMTAFATGESVQTGSGYIQPNGRIPACPNCRGYTDDVRPNVAPISFDHNTYQKETQPSENDLPENIPEIIEQQENDQRTLEPTTTVLTPELSEVTTVPPKKNKPNKPRSRKPVVVEEEDDDDDEPAYNPFSGGRKGYPIYNSFFPMVFGGGEGFGPAAPVSRKTGSQQSGGGRSGYPGATAIANSFSTGKGGVATSHATAYGPSPQ